MSNFDTTHHLDPASLGEQAAEVIRALNHVTRDADAFAGPADACQLVTALATMTGRLPQLLAQINGWLRTELAAGRLLVDTKADTDAAGELLEVVANCLERANDCADGLYRGLDSAQQHASHLALTS